MLPHTKRPKTKRIALRTPALRTTIVLTLFACAPAAYAQQPPANPTTETEEGLLEKSAPRNSALRPTLDLGHFKINDLRPTRNETAKLTFSLHLALSSDVSEQQLAQLQHWKHRLRNQVIIVVRTIETKDFQASDLALLRQKILLRVNRLLRTKLAEDVFLTEYLFRLH